MKIQGYISDEKNLPLPFVNIYVKGQEHIGTTSNSDGYFTLDAPSGEILVFSFVGYQTEEMIIPNGQVSVSIVLKEEVNQLPESVVEYTLPKKEPIKTEIKPSFNNLIKKHKKWFWLGGLLIFGGVVYSIVNSNKNSNENKKPKKVDL